MNENTALNIEESFMTTEYILSSTIKEVIPYFIKYGIDHKKLLENILKNTDSLSIDDLSPLSMSFNIAFQSYNYHLREKNEVMTSFFDQIIMELHLEYLENSSSYIINKKDSLFIDTIFESII